MTSGSEAKASTRRVEECLQPTSAPPSYKTFKRLGVAATAFRIPTEPNPISHAAILYKVKQEVRLFEMKSHEVLADSPARPGFVWIEPTIPIERVLLVIQRMKLVLKAHQSDKVPYGFSYRTSAFDENGGYRLGTDEVGFTCSTIVAAIFEAEGLPLIDPLTWPPPDRTDQEARESFLARLEKQDAAHAAALRKDINAPRISPEEVVASAAAYPVVGTFDNLQEGADAVRTRLGV